MKEEVKQEVIKKIFVNVVKAIIITICLLLLNIAYIKLDTEVYKRTVQIVTMIALFVAIYLFERAYKEDKEETALDGIEILVFSAYILTIKHITQKYGLNYKFYVMLVSYVFDIYFILKSIIIYTKGRKEISDSYSDIREIVKKEEPIKKEATKKRKKEVKEND